MPLTPLLVILALAVPAGLLAAKTKPTCAEFGKGAELKEADVVATWYLQGPEAVMGARDAKCLQFTAVDDKGRKDLEDRIGKYIPDLRWARITLKMQIPCTNGSNDRANEYYLEKLDDVGSYKTLDVPAPNAKLEPSVFHRHPMRLKSMFGYLAMMDCHENFVFLLGRQPQNGAKLDEKVALAMKDYWPQE